MSQPITSRSALLELREESAAMREGYAFLDEKCLLLAGEILREIARAEAAGQALLARRRSMFAALADALARHGLEGLGAYPLAPAAPAQLQVRQRGLMGVPLVDASASADVPQVAEPLLRTPEAAACAARCADLLAPATQLAASLGNLQRLIHEYQRTVRRARALDGVLLPELDRAVHAMDGALEAQEQEDAIFMRPRSR